MIQELPTYPQKGWETKISIWSELEQQDSLNKLKKGALLHSLRMEFGSNAMEKFVWETGATEAIPTLNEYARIHRRLMGLAWSEQCEIVVCIDTGVLSYSHVREAHHKMKKDVEFVGILREAQDNNWRKRRLMEEMAKRTNQRGYTPYDPDNPPEDPPEVAGQVPHNTHPPDLPEDPEAGTSSAASWGQLDGVGVLCSKPGLYLVEGDPFEGTIPQSREVEDAELAKLIRVSRDMCDLLMDREDPEEDVIEVVEAVAESFTHLAESLKTRKRKGPAEHAGGGGLASPAKPS